MPSFGTNFSDAKTHTTWRDEITAEVRAIESELGTTPSGSYSTVKDRLETQTVYQQDASAGGTTSGTTFLLQASITIPSQSVPGIVVLSGIQLFATFTVSTDNFDLIIRNTVGPATVGGARVAATANDQSAAIVRVIALAASTAVTYQMGVQRVTGTGTTTLNATSTFSRLDAVWHQAV